MKTAIRDSIGAFRFIQHQQGWRQAFIQSAEFLRMPFYEFHQGFVLRKSLSGTINVPPPKVALVIRQAVLADLDLLGSIVPPLRVRRIAKKMRAGELCFVAIDGDQVVAYVFSGFAGTPSTREARLQLEPKEAYLWAGFALPAYRRQGVVRAVNLSLCQHLKGIGYTGVVLLVEKRNRASLGHCRKMGYRVTEQITYLRVLGWGKTHILPAEPGLA